MRTERVPGSFFSFTLSQLSPNSIYNISVRAGTDFDELGIPAFKIISLKSRGPEFLDRIPAEEMDLKEEESERIKLTHEFERKQIEEERDRIEYERKRLQMEYDRLNREREREREQLKYEYGDQLEQQHKECYEHQQKVERERLELLQRQQQRVHHPHRQQEEDAERRWSLRERKRLEYERTQQPLDQIQVLPERSDKRGERVDVTTNYADMCDFC